jgi:ferritin-like metal-binding protein YciE
MEDITMGNEIKAALEKQAKLQERYARMEAIFEKSKTKREGTIAKLQMLIERCNKKQEEIIAKETKVLEDLAGQIVLAKQEEEALKAIIKNIVTEKTEVPVAEVQE